MPTYKDGMSPEDLTVATSANTTEIQRMQMEIDKVSTQMGRMLDLMGKARDLTKDEVSEVVRWKDTISQVADEEKRLHGTQIKGMSDYSIFVKKVEDQIKGLQKTQNDASSQAKKLQEQNTKIQSSVTGRFNKENNKYLRDELGLNEKNSAKLRTAAKERFESNKKLIEQNKELEKFSAKQLDQNKQTLTQAEKAQRMSNHKINAERRQRGGTDMLEMASDLHLPGVSQAATIAKYARRGASVGEDDNGDPVGGAAGMLARGGGLMGGLLKGGAIVAGGYTAMQGYKAYNLSHQMAPVARTLGGQGNTVGDRQNAIQEYGGYGGIENMQYLSQLNRAVGGRNGMGQLRSATKMANQFGLERGEVAGQMAAYGQAGGSQKDAVKDLEKIMIEGVKSGMDRARITEFTQNTMRIQGEIFRITGRNNAQGISEALGQLMRASGQGEKFMHGAAMGAVGGLDSAVKGAASGSLQGPASGTLMRAFGHGANGKEFGVKAMINARRDMEGGLFGQGDGKKTVGRINDIFEQYGKESGGDADTAKYRMSSELGIGMNQLDELDKIRKKGGNATEEDMKRVKEIQDSSKDPLVRVAEISAKMNANLAALAGSEKGIGAVLAIDKQLLELQKRATNALEKLAGTAQGDGSDTMDVAQTGAAGIGTFVKGGAAAGSLLKGGGQLASKFGAKGTAKMLGKMGAKSLATASPFLGNVLNAGSTAMDIHEMYGKFRDGKNITAGDVGKLGGHAAGMFFPPAGLAGDAIELGQAMGVGGDSGMAPNSDPNTTATERNTKAIEENNQLLKQVSSGNKSNPMMKRTNSHAR